MTDTLKSICEQCAQLLNPQLDFLPEQSARHKEIILRDLGELVSAASLELEKGVVVLAGGLFEAVLFSFIQSQEDSIADRRGSFAFDPEQSLDNYVSIFNRYFRKVTTIPDIVVEYRNMVHINQELHSAPDACRNAAPLMLRLLDSLLEGLSDYARG